MLEANALQDVVQLDVDAEIVGVELELVAGLQPAVFVDVHGQRRDAAIDGQPPMAIFSAGHVESDQLCLLQHVRHAGYSSLQDEGRRCEAACRATHTRPTFDIDAL